MKLPILQKTGQIASRLKASYYGYTTCALLLMSNAASAEGISDMVGELKDQSTSAGNDAITIFATLGIPIAGIGVFNWYRKSKEGDHSNIQAAKIWPNPCWCLNDRLAIPIGCVWRNYRYQRI